jgi:pimeloyl-ACP methyl ester carboxylesterase
MTTTIEMLPVPGAQLYSETRGQGPLLVFIVGGNGDAEVFAAAAAALAWRFTVVTYDRRGFSRSPVEAPVADAARIARDADDAAQVIAVRGGGPALVFGSSSGAIVGLELMARHPAAVHALIAHEPPLVTLLPDGDAWLARFERVVATYRASGPGPAMREFGAAVGLDLPPDPPPGVRLPPNIAGMLSRMSVNQVFWLEHELLPYPRYVPDIAALRAAPGRLVLGAGRTPPDAPLARPARALAAALPAPVVEFAGGHVGYVTDPAEFAAEMVNALALSTP